MSLYLELLSNLLWSPESLYTKVLWSEGQTAVGIQKLIMSGAMNILHKRKPQKSKFRKKTPATTFEQTFKVILQFYSICNHSLQV